MQQVPGRGRGADGVDSASVEAGGGVASGRTNLATLMNSCCDVGIVDRAEEPVFTVVEQKNVGCVSCGHDAARRRNCLLVFGRVDGGGNGDLRVMGGVVLRVGRRYRKYASAEEGHQGLINFF